VLGLLLVSSGAGASTVEFVESDDVEYCEFSDTDEPFRLSCGRGTVMQSSFRNTALEGGTATSLAGAAGIDGG